MPARQSPTERFARVRSLGLKLPDTEEGTSYGTPALRVKKKFIARLHDNGEWLVLKLDFESRDDLLQRHPKIFFTTDHYRGYPIVLVNLERASDKQLAALLKDAWQLAVPKKLREQAPSKRPKAKS